MRNRNIGHRLYPKFLRRRAVRRTRIARVYRVFSRGDRFAPQARHAALRSVSRCPHIARARSRQRQSPGRCSNATPSVRERRRAASSIPRRAHADRFRGRRRAAHRSVGALDAARRALATRLAERSNFIECSTARGSARRARSICVALCSARPSTICAALLAREAASAGGCRWRVSCSAAVLREHRARSPPWLADRSLVVFVEMPRLSATPCWHCCGSRGATRGRTCSCARWSGHERRRLSDRRVSRDAAGRPRRRATVRRHVSADASALDDAAAEAVGAMGTAAR